MPAESLVSITNPDRVLWPDDEITKQQLIEHYRRVAPLILPELDGRPLTLVRAPAGIGGETFFQKNAPDYTPEWIRTVTIPAPSAKRDVRFIVCDSLDTLLWVGNQAAIELHPTLDREDRPGRPDLLVFDMDPPAGRLDLAVVAALVIRKELEGRGLRPSVKTTGGKGIHVFARLERRYGFDQTHAFAVAAAKSAIEKEQSLMTLEFKKADRLGRVFVDVHRNGPGATLVAAFSPRARPGAPISFPITWSDLEKGRDIHFDLERARKSLTGRRVMEWQKGLALKQRLPSRLS